MRACVSVLCCVCVCAVSRDHCRVCPQIYRHDRTDLVETHLEGTLREARDHTAAWTRDAQAQWRRHVGRLETVREEKERRRVELLGESGRREREEGGTEGARVGERGGRREEMCGTGGEV